MKQSVDASRRAPQRIWILDVSLDEIHRNRSQRFDAARGTHQRTRPKPARRKQLHEMVADETTGAGNENAFHLLSLFRSSCYVPVTPRPWQTYHLRSQRMRWMRAASRLPDCRSTLCLLPGVPSERKTGRREGLLSPSVEVKTTPGLQRKGVCA